MPLVPELRPSGCWMPKTTSANFYALSRRSAQREAEGLHGRNRSTAARATNQAPSRPRDRRHSDRTRLCRSYAFRVQRPRPSRRALRAIIDFYGPSPAASETTSRFLELSRRQLAHLDQQIAKQSPAYLKLIDENLSRADHLHTTDPTKARAIWTSIIELYADKPWAADRVEQSSSWNEGNAELNGEARLDRSAVVPLARNQRVHRIRSSSSCSPLPAPRSPLSAPPPPLTTPPSSDRLSTHGPPSSSGPGRRVLSPKTGVRLPVGVYVQMAKYLISFPSAAMVAPDGEWEAVGRDAHAVIDEAKAAGVYVFGGGIDEAVPPVLVSADGTFSAGGYSSAPPLNGGFTVLELPSREEAIAWAAPSRRPAAATKSYECSGSIPLLKVDRTISSRGTAEQSAGANAGFRRRRPALIALRIARDLSQRELAERLGVHESQVSQTRATNTTA